MIDRVILNLLKENGFDGNVGVVNEFLNNAILAYRKNDIKTEFYIVVSINQKEFLELDENKIFSELSKSLRETPLYTGEVDKNTSLVICVAKDNKVEFNDALERKELQCEENPYFFKKYVLSYEKILAERVFGDILMNYGENTKLTQHIESIITSPDNFKKFKLNSDNNGEYLLLSKIIMKVPVIPVKVPDNKSINSLSAMVRDSISSLDLYQAQDLVSFMSETNNKEANEDDMISLIIDFWTKEQE